MARNHDHCGVGNDNRRCMVGFAPTLWDDSSASAGFNGRANSSLDSAVDTLRDH